MSEAELQNRADALENRDREGAGESVPPAATAPHPAPDGRGSPGRGRLVLVTAAVVLVVGALVALGYALFRDRGPADDLGRLQGVWKVSAYGRETQATIRVEGDRWTYSAGGMEGRSYRLILRPDASPKEIDLVLLNEAGEPAAVTHGSGKGSAVGMRGVYAIEGETVRVVLRPGVEERPKSMDEVGEAQVMTLTRRTD